MAGLVLSLILPELSSSIWSYILGVVLGLGCFVYLMWNGYLAQITGGGAVAIKYPPAIFRGNIKGLFVIPHLMRDPEE